MIKIDYSDKVQLNVFVPRFVVEMLDELAEGNGNVTRPSLFTSLIIEKHRLYKIAMRKQAQAFPTVSQVDAARDDKVDWMREE